jgi:hypothetical protein
VFVDLIARMVLTSLNLIPEDQKLNEDFHLILHASFMSREEAIALELLEMF